MRYQPLGSCLFLATLFLVSSFALAGDEPVRIDKDRYLGAPVHVKNMTAWPIYSDNKIAKLKEYLTLEEAEEAKLAQVREIGVAPSAPDAVNNEGPNSPDQTAESRDENQGNGPDSQPDAQQNRTRNIQPQQIQQRQGSNARVNALVIENTSDKPILVLAGQIVKGGKQDRLIGQDFICPPGKVTQVDAFCVEKGRWTQQQGGKDTGGNFKGKRALANFGTRAGGQYKKDQQAVWQSVAKTNDAVGNKPGSGTLLATIEDESEEAKALRTEMEQALTKAFQIEGENQPVGIAYAIDGKVREVRVFAHPKLFRSYAPLMFSTIAIEADIGQRSALAQKKEVYTAPADAKQIITRLEEIRKAKEERVKTSGSNTNVYQKLDRAASARTEDDSVEGEANKSVTEVWSFF